MCVLPRGVRQRELGIVAAVYKSGTGTRGRVCGDLGLGDARRGTSGHQVWDAGTSNTGTQRTRVVNDYRKSRR